MWHIQQQKQYIWCLILNYICWVYVCVESVLSGGRDGMAVAG